MRLVRHTIMSDYNDEAMLILRPTGTITELPVYGDPRMMLMDLKVRELDGAHVERAELYYAGTQILSSWSDADGGNINDWKPFTGGIPCHALTYHRLHLCVWGQFKPVKVYVEIRPIPNDFMKFIDTFEGRLDNGKSLKVKDGILVVE